MSGLAAIKVHGGITIVQNLSDAEVPDMPLSACADVDGDRRAHATSLPDLLIRFFRMPVALNTPSSGHVEGAARDGYNSGTEAVQQAADLVQGSQR